MLLASLLCAAYSLKSHDTAINYGVPDSEYQSWKQVRDNQLDVMLPGQVINFRNTWYSPCINTTKELKKEYSQEVAFLYISSTSSPEYSWQMSQNLRYEQSCIASIDSAQKRTSNSHDPLRGSHPRHPIQTNIC